MPAKVLHYKVMGNVFRCLDLLCVARCCGVERTQYNYNPLPRCQAAALELAVVLALRVVLSHVHDVCALHVAGLV